MAKPGGGTIIIKKIKKGGHHAHHGGAWKVAYADFVTAMMAFFLLLWLLNVTTDVQKKGIADYFEPSVATLETVSGAGAMLGGQVIGKPGSMTVSAAAPALANPVASMRQPDGRSSNSRSPSSSSRRRWRTCRSCASSPTTSSSTARPRGCASSSSTRTSARCSRAPRPRCTSRHGS
jgi:chemotaxis protein MotB